MTVIDGEILDESTPHTPLSTPLARRTWLGAGRLLDGLWTGAEHVAYGAAAVLVRWPRQTTVVTVVLPALPYVSWTHVTGTVLAGSALLIARPGIRARIPILSDSARTRKRIARIRADWPRVCADIGLVKPGKDKGTPRTPAVRSAVPTPVGVRLTVSGQSVSMSTAAFVSKSASIRTGLGAKDITITSNGQNTDIDLIFRDPFVRTILSRTLPDMSRDNPGTVVTGLDSFGQPVVERPAEHRLYVGLPASGKSSAIWRLIEGMQAAGIHFRLRIYDPKGGLEFAALEDAAYQYTANPFDLEKVIANAYRAYEARAADMRAHGIRRLDIADMGTERWPLDILLIDEMITALKTNKKSTVRIDGRNMDLADGLLQYMSVSPGIGQFVWAATQLGQKEVLSVLADMFGSKTILRVASDDAARIVMGDAKLYPAHEIPNDPASKGVGYTFSELAGRPIKYKAAWVPPEARRRIARDMELATAAQRKRTTWDKN